jgi:hypothetical protein
MHAQRKQKRQEDKRQMLEDLLIVVKAIHLKRMAASPQLEIEAK